MVGSPAAVETERAAAEVVKYSGTLHDRSYPWMREDADTADLCLVLGTSLGGLNADQALQRNINVVFRTVKMFLKSLQKIVHPLRK